MDRRHVLLVEDNPDDEYLAIRALRECGIRAEISVARDGAEALEHLFGAEARRQGAALLPPDLVLLDLKLPKIGGLDVLRDIRKDGRTQYVPVVVLTTSNEEQDLFSAYRLGANNYLLKAPDYPEFRDALGTICGHWLTIAPGEAQREVEEAPALRLRGTYGPFAVADLYRISERVGSRLRTDLPRHSLLDAATAIVLIGEHLRPTLADFETALGTRDASVQAAMAVLGEFAWWMGRSAQSAPLDELRDRVLKAHHAITGVLVYIRGHR